MMSFANNWKQQACKMNTFNDTDLPVKPCGANTPIHYHYQQTSRRE